jgi:hypothetical protein
MNISLFIPETTKINHAGPVYPVAPEDGTGVGLENRIGSILPDDVFAFGQL